MNENDTQTAVLSFAMWEEQYAPVNNHLDNNASFHDGENGLMFETSGDELDFVLNQPTTNVWTYIDSEFYDDPVIINGYHLVNRIGYFVTKKPFTQPTTVIIN